MAEVHEFFEQPGSNPSWCFCEEAECPGWAAYLTWACDGSNCLPGGAEIRLHRRVTEILADLQSLYSDLTGTAVSYDEALALAAWETDEQPLCVSDVSLVLELYGITPRHGPAAPRAHDADGEAETGRAGLGATSLAYESISVN